MEVVPCNFKCPLFIIELMNRHGIQLPIESRCLHQLSTSVPAVYHPEKREPAPVKEHISPHVGNVTGPKFHYHAWMLQMNFVDSVRGRKRNRRKNHSGLTDTCCRGSKKQSQLAILLQRYWLNISDHSRKNGPSFRKLKCWGNKKSYYFPWDPA